MKRAIFLVTLLLASVSADANAWFFFFLPGSVTSKIADSFTGSEGENCVGEKANVGDTIRSPSGSTATIKSLSGTSSRCTNPLLPIRALLVFNSSFVSKAGINVPDEYEPKQLTDAQKFNGGVLSAVHPTTTAGIYVSARKRETNSDPAQITHAAGVALSNAIVDAKTSNEEQITINGMRAWRFELTGKNKGVFGRTYTYLVTVLEGDEELVMVNAFALTDDYEKEKEALKQVVASVTGIKAPISQIVHTPAGAQVIPASTTAPATTGGISAAESKEAADKNLSTTGTENIVSDVLANKTTFTPAIPPVPANNGANMLEKPSGQPSAAQRLKELNALYKERLIDEKSFEAKKQEILKGI